MGRVIRICGGEGSGVNPDVAPRACVRVYARVLLLVPPNRCLLDIIHII